MIYIRYIAVFAALMITTGGCHTLKPEPATAGRAMPGTYTSKADTAMPLVANWRLFFTDPQLIGLIDTALANNWDLSIALQRIEAARANVLLNKGAMKPYVRAVGAAGINRYGAYTMDGAGNSTTPIYDGRIIPTDLPTYTIGLQASWEADVWGKLKNRKKAALARFVATVEGRNVVVTNLVATVAADYYSLLALDAQLAIIDENITLQENALGIVRVLKEVATANQLAVEQFEARLAGLRSLRLQVVMQINEQENNINLLLGRYPRAIARNSTGITASQLPGINAGIPAVLLQNRPDIRQAEAELAATRADVNAAKAAFYPSFVITAGTGFAAFKTALLFSMPQSVAYNVLGSLAAPLINRSALRADQRTAQASRQEAIYNYQRTITRGYTEVYTELQRINNLQQIYELRTAQVTTLTSAIETASELFKTGRSSYLEVLITQQNALQSRLERVETRKQQFQTTANIYKALGGGWR